MENRVYKVPLREVRKYPRGVRTKKAMSKLKEFLRRHTNSENIKIGSELNEYLWSRGGQKPPKNIEVAVSEIEGQIYCNLPEEEVERREVKEEFECEECGETFDSERGLKVHKSQVHREAKEEEKEEEPEETEEDLYRCSKCGKEFETKRGLSIHESQKHPEEETEEDYEEILKGTITEGKGEINSMEAPDYEELLKLEREGKDRKGMKQFLEGKLED